MLSSVDLRTIARARLKDADALYSLRRYDGALYLCGYSIEIALKSRIVRTLKWPGFPESNKEFSGLLSFRSHDLNVLLQLSGWEGKVRSKFLPEWSIVSSWTPELRYKPPGIVTDAEAKLMIDSVKRIIGAML